jgi:CelD/BcsL family acetyltransferase involved in cellulose biosynthesis
VTGRNSSTPETQSAPRRAASSGEAGLHLHMWRDTPEARAEWDRLAGGIGNVFASAAWGMTWWRHWGSEDGLLVGACRRSDGALAAILPLYVSARRPLRVLRFIGHGAGDLLGPVCAPHDRTQTVAALARLLAGDRVRWDLLVAQQIASGEGWTEALGGNLVRRERNPTLALDWSSWDDYLASRSANFRQQVRRRERRLARQHELRFRLTTSEETLEADLGVLFALHKARWRDEASPALRESRQSFHREFASQALKRGWLRLWFLELDGRPAAAWYGFRCGDIESYYQAGRDPSWDNHSVGLVLLAHTIRSALEDGMREYRFLRGAESYKNRFTDDMGELETFLVHRGIIGAAAGAVARVAARRTSRSGPLAAARRMTGLRNA